jgi:hypothetical protein
MIKPSLVNGVATLLLMLGVGASSIAAPLVPGTLAGPSPPSVRASMWL